MTTNNKPSELRISEVPKTLRELALERMRAAIVDMRFKPGERLTERDLCDQLGVSRSVVREVMRHLEAENLVQTIPNHGLIVARLDAHQAAEIYQIRGLLESSAAHACAQCASDKQISGLLKALESIEKSYKIEDYVGVLSATTRFYEVMFAGAEHPIAWDIVRQLNGRISRLRALTIMSPRRNVTGPSQMRKIYAAIAARKPEAAAEACREHIHNASAIALDTIRSQDQPSAESGAKVRRKAAKGAAAAPAPR